MNITSKHLHALTRAELALLEGAAPGPGEVQPLSAESLTLHRVQGISCGWDEPPRVVEQWRALMSDLLAGCWALGRKLVFVVSSLGETIELLIGTESSAEEDVLPRLLHGAFPGTSMSPLARDDARSMLQRLSERSHRRLLVGTPMIESEGAGHLERLLRAGRRARWAYVVVATPASPEETERRLTHALNERRKAREYELSSGSSKPIAEQYDELLEAMRRKLVVGQGCGMWHATVQLLAEDSAAYAICSGALASSFSNGVPHPDPVRGVSLRARTPALMSILTPSDEKTAPFFPYRYQCLLSSRELSWFVTLPREEHPGYHVRRHAAFDAAPPSLPPDAHGIDLGPVVDRGEVLGVPYRVELERLRRHALVVGNTGSGKTNTLFGMLQALPEGLPFLVVEPAKTEYRRLCAARPELEVFTLGRPGAPALCINPFEVLPGVAVQTQIDNLMSLFNAVFVLYAPMPYVLERCVYEIYVDRGWDLTRGVNVRGAHQDAHPSLTDLYNKVRPVVASLGYERRLRMDITAALETRIDSLRIGARGRMLDVRRSFPMDELLRRSVILELEHVGSDEEKAFIIGLLLMRLQQHYSVSAHEDDRLRHLTVIEEAHRLFTNVSRELAYEHANVRGQAVERFCNILAEVRAQGEAIIIAEQIPTKLAPEVVKNTSLKIAHRLSALDDLEVMGASMNMDDRQLHHLATLDVGAAAVFGLGDDRPLLVQVPRSSVHASLEQSLARAPQAPERQTPFERALDRARESQAVREIVERSEHADLLAKETLGAAIGACPLSTLRASLQRAVGSARAHEDHEELMCAVWAMLVDRALETFGQANSVDFADVARLKSLMFGLLEDGGAQLTSAVRAHAQLEVLPFVGCEFACPDRLCLFRAANRETLSDEGALERFIRAGVDHNGQERWLRIAEVCRVASGAALPSSCSSEARLRCGLCYAVQAVSRLNAVDDQGRIKLIENTRPALQQLLSRGA